MITYLKVNGFKSFQNFEMEFAPYTVIAGLNASGKSNLFDVLKLLSTIAGVDNLKKAFKEQRGELLELFTQYGEDKYVNEMSFEVEMLVNRTVTDAWGNEAELKYTRLRYELTIERRANSMEIEDVYVKYESLENLKHQKDSWIKNIPITYREDWRPKVNKGKRGVPYIQTTIENNTPTVTVPQDGTAGNKRRFALTNSTRSVLSSFDTVDFPHVLAAKEEMKSWKFLELNPEELRKPTSKTTGEDTISSSGRNLAGALFRIKQEDPYNLKLISRKLNSFIPSFISVDVEDDKENKQYVIKLKDNDHKTYSSRVLSEGTLRILALSILEFDLNHSGLLCFEEPENGIHPFRIEAMVRLLKDLSTDYSSKDLPLRQVIVNTHSQTLVGLIEKWKSDPNVQLWYSSIKTRIFDVDGTRLKMPVTSMVPLSKTENNQMKIHFTNEELKLTIAVVKDYLESSTISN